MDGFFQRKYARIGYILGLVSGVSLAVLFGLFLCLGTFDTLDDQLVSGFFTCFGCLHGAICGLSLYTDYKAFIHLEDGRISAFCQHGLALECEIADIAYLSYDDYTLALQLKSGKKYSLYHLTNAEEIGRYIQRRMPQDSEQPQEEAGLPEMYSFQRKYRREGIGMILCVFLCLAGIILAAGLTGWKDLNQFTPDDWRVLAVMAVLCVGLMAAIIILARKSARHLRAFQLIRCNLYREIMYDAPLRPGNVCKVLVNDPENPSIRVTVFGFPNTEEVYFNVEGIDRNYDLVCTYASAVYPNARELPPELAEFTEIEHPDLPYR